jgi:DNA-binding response OmpR family regulator
VSKQSLLLVDGDTRSLRVLEVSLRKAGFTVTAATSVKDALDKLEVHTPDLIISETNFGTESDGFELRRRVRAEPAWAEIPFVFLTAEIAIENKIRGLELGVEDYLTKPIYIKEIVTRINILLQKRQRAGFDTRRDGVRFAGRVADMPIVDVIQTIEVSRKSGVINFVGMHGRQAAIYFRDGRVIDAEAGTLQGEDAVYRLLTWNDGEFEVEFRTVRRREAITTSSQGLLMEGMRRLDEWTRLLEQLPPLTHRFEIDFDELARRLGEVPDDNNRILRLIDSKRSLIEVIDASDVGDLECIQAISRLYFEGLLLDLDPDKRARRESGRPVPLVVVEAPPTPIEEVASGPVVIGAIALRPRVVPAAPPIEERGIVDLTEHPFGGSDGRATVPVEQSARSASARATDPMPQRPLRSAQHPGPAAVVVQPAAAVVEPAAVLVEHPVEPPLPPPSAELVDPSLPPLSGGVRPSGLRLIDEAVAAAQLIEPALFEPEAALFEPEPSLNGTSPSVAAELESAGHGANASAMRDEGAGAERPPADDLGAPPEDLPRIASEEPTEAESASAERFAVAMRREDSGLRIIQSAGLDRAEASGELSSKGSPTPQPAERELVTILPRRITRDFPVVDAAELEAGAPAPTPDSPAPPEVFDGLTSPRFGGVAGRAPVQPVERPEAEVEPVESVEPLEPVESISEPSPAPVSSVRAGPGPGAKVLLALAAGLAVVTVYTYCQKKRAVAHRVIADARREAVAVSLEFDDASGGVIGDGPAPLVPAVDAREVAVSPPVPVDASPAVPTPDARLATSVSNLPPGDAGVAAGSEPRARADAGASVADEQKKQAAQLLEQAQQALEDGEPDRALDLADQSLKLRRTQRTLLERAHALQRLGRIDDSLQSIDEALEIASSAPAWEQRAVTLWSARRYDEAKAAMQKYIEMFPKGGAVETFRQMLQQQP